MDSKPPAPSEPPLSEPPSSEGSSLVQGELVDEELQIEVQKLQLLDKMLDTFSELAKQAQHKELRVLDVNDAAHARGIAAQTEAYKLELPFREGESKRRFRYFFSSALLCFGTVLALVLTGHEDQAGWVVAVLTALGAALAGRRAAAKETDDV